MIISNISEIQINANLSKKNNEIIIEILGSEPWDFIYKAQKLEQIGMDNVPDSVRIKIEWIHPYVRVQQEDGSEKLCEAQSFEELGQLELKREKIDPNTWKEPFWQRFNLAYQGARSE